MTPMTRKQSELLFEEYLTAQGYSDWSHEPPVEGKSKRPDFRLNHGGSSHFFEVKEFDAPNFPPGYGGAYNPYKPIREKINQATRQFKEYKESSCSLVLANPNLAVVQLETPSEIIGAMLGNLGFQIPVDAISDEGLLPEQVFMGGGKMVDDKHQSAQNTTFSSIIVLCTYPLWQNQFRAAIKMRQRELGRKTTLEEEFEFIDAIPNSPDLRRVRAVVHENPCARIPLSRDLFVGPFDERWGVEGEFIKRVYVGREIVSFEEAVGNC